MEGKNCPFWSKSGVHPNPIACGLMQMAHDLLHFGVPGWALNLEATGRE